MKILINGLQLSNKNTGVQYYTKNLYSELKKNESDTLKFHLLLSSNIPSSVNTRLKRIFFENFSLQTYLKKSNLNLYHSTNYILPYFFNFPSILTIHDLITLDYPELCQTESVLYFRLLLARSIKKANKIIAVSNTVKNDILRHFNIPGEKVEVIYHGINPIFKKTSNKAILEKYHLPEKYILFVGNIEPKKNLQRLIQAFHLLKRNTDLQHKLVIVGKKGWKYSPVFNTITELKIENEIIFTDYVLEEDLPAIYSIADLFVFPSLYEGFGIPPLEAMACEVPVIVSNKGSLPEITHRKCLQVDPYNIDAIAKGMYKLLTDTNLIKNSIEQGKEWVKQFTWEKSAKKTLCVYESVMNELKI